MKHKNFFAGILGLVLVFGILFSGCANPGGGESVQQVTLTYNKNGAAGTAPESKTVDKGSKVIIADEGSLSYTGYTFKGWNTEKNGTGDLYESGDSLTLNEDTTLYAQWFAASTNNSTSNDVATLGIKGTKASSGNAQVATVEIKSDKITITSVGPGSTIITVENAAGNSATIAVTVASNGTITIGSINKYGNAGNSIVGTWITQDLKKVIYFGADESLYYIKSANVAKNAKIKKIPPSSWEVSSAFYGTYEYQLKENNTQLEEFSTGASGYIYALKLDGPATTDASNPIAGFWITMVSKAQPVRYGILFSKLDAGVLNVVEGDYEPHTYTFENNNLTVDTGSPGAIQINTDTNGQTTLKMREIGGTATLTLISASTLFPAFF
jgi:uncharacterized repeat protein (TIGR02543 family)